MYIIINIIIVITVLKRPTFKQTHGKEDNKRQTWGMESEYINTI